MHDPKPSSDDDQTLDELSQKAHESQLRVGYAKGEVIIQFGLDFRVGLHPREAKGLAHLLLKYANPVTRP